MGWKLGVEEETRVRLAAVEVTAEEGRHYVDNDVMCWSILMRAACKVFWSFEQDGSIRCEIKMWLIFMSLI